MTIWPKAQGLEPGWDLLTVSSKTLEQTLPIMQLLFMPPGIWSGAIVFFLISFFDGNPVADSASQSFTWSEMMLFELLVFLFFFFFFWYKSVQCCVFSAVFVSFISTLDPSGCFITQLTLCFGSCLSPTILCWCVSGHTAMGTGEVRIILMRNKGFYSWFHRLGISPHDYSESISSPWWSLHRQPLTSVPGCMSSRPCCTTPVHYSSTWLLPPPASSPHIWSWFTH